MPINLASPDNHSIVISGTQIDKKFVTIKNSFRKSLPKGVRVFTSKDIKDKDIPKHQFDILVAGPDASLLWLKEAVVKKAVLLSPIWAAKMIDQKQWVEPDPEVHFFGKRFPEDEDEDADMDEQDSSGGEDSSGKGDSSSGKGSSGKDNSKGKSKEVKAEEEEESILDFEDGMDPKRNAFEKDPTRKAWYDKVAGGPWTVTVDIHPADELSGTKLPRMNYQMCIEGIYRSWFVVTDPKTPIFVLLPQLRDSYLIPWKDHLGLMDRYTTSNGHQLARRAEKALKQCSIMQEFNFWSIAFNGNVCMIVGKLPDDKEPGVWSRSEFKKNIRQ
ncbi:hypothetical protein V8C35DRAFT_307726 [Trichoderma chlorosporum]